MTDQSGNHTAARFDAVAQIKTSGKQAFKPDFNATLIAIKGPTATDALRWCVAQGTKKSGST
jgi:hypothetical protein